MDLMQLQNNVNHLNYYSTIHVDCDNIKSSYRVPGNSHSPDLLDIQSRSKEKSRLTQIQI